MNLKDRLSIKMDVEMRKGIVQFDNWVMSAKVKDLPCVMESQKTIDNKTFYKTADVSQVRILPSNYNIFHLKSPSELPLYGVVVSVLGW